MIITIFGASGDLSQRKLFPSLSKTNPKAVIGYSRSPLQDTFIQRLKESYAYDPSFLQKISYVQGDYDKIEMSCNEGCFYLSVPPSTYVPILKELQKCSGIVAIEKPFARSLKEYVEIQKLEKPNLRFYLIDHYLLKPMCLAMNEIKSKVWRNDIESIFVIGKEELGVEGRNYFDATGMVKDIVQNHLLSLYSLFMSEVNNDLNTDEENRIEILNDTTYIQSKLGQYREYQDEIGHKSDVETFALVELYNTKVNCKVILMAGKGLNEKRTEIRVKYKKEGFLHVIDTLKKLKTEDCENAGRIKLEDIKNIELILNLAPLNDVRLILEIRNSETKEYVIMQKNEIKECAAKLYGKMDDHALVFDCIQKNKDFPKTNVKEGKLEWQIFSKVEYNKLFYYEKGEDMPKDAENMLNSIL